MIESIERIKPRLFKLPLPGGRTSLTFMGLVGEWRGEMLFLDQSDNADFDQI